MAIKPVAWQEEGPANSLDEWVNEPWMQGEVGASHNSPLQDKEAPRAEPEEDIDFLVPADQDKAQEIMANLVPQLSVTTQVHEDLENITNLIDEEALSTPSPNIDLSTEEWLEEDTFYKQEGEVAEWFMDVEIISNQIEERMSPERQTSQEWPQKPQLNELVNRGAEMTTEEALGKLITSLEFSNKDEDGINTSAAGSMSDDVDRVSSLPFADEGEEEEEVSMNVTSCQQQLEIMDIRTEPLQLSYSANVLISTEQDPTSVLPTVTSAQQQEELSSQGQCEPAPKGTNQETSQQVFGQSSAPLSTVAMEPPNLGGAASQASGCVVTVSERHSRVGERTEREKETGGEKGQKDSGPERNQAVGQQYGGGLLRYSNNAQIGGQKTEKYSCGVTFEHIRHTRMESDSCDDSQSDSGVSADFSPCSTLEGSGTIPAGSPATVPKETPIEREIRRAIEREQSLRRSRGLPNPPTCPEYVDIPLRKTVLSQPLPAKSERCKGKDRQFADKKMQHEIREEAQREQHLVRLGKVPGFYDKGTVRQLKERKQLFEAFQKPSDSTSTVSGRSEPTSWSSANDISTLENQEGGSSQASTVRDSDVERRWSIDLLSPTNTTDSAKRGGSTSSTPRGPGISEGSSCHVTIIENNLSVPPQRLYHTKPQTEAVTVVDSGAPYVLSGGIIEREQEKEEEEELAPKENPFFKLRSSTNLVKVEQDIRETQEREKELHKQRISLYGGTRCAKERAGGGGGGGGGGRLSSMEGKSPMLPYSTVNGLAVPDTPGSSSRGGTGHPAARQSVGRFTMWPPAQAEEEEKINRPEVRHSPRTPRQKSPLVHQWESGLINGHNKEGND